MVQEKVRENLKSRKNKKQYRKDSIISIITISGSSVNIYIVTIM